MNTQRIFPSVLECITLIFLLCSGSVWSGGFDNFEDEKRYQRLIYEVRCLVCQSQSIADSDADLARDLRALIKEKVLASESEHAIKQFLIERYGSSIVFKPPWTMSTYFLWLFPPFFLLAAVTFFVLYIKRTVMQRSDKQHMKIDV